MEHITSESTLYDLWERYAVAGRTLATLDGQRVIVLSAGTRNHSPGPDFSDAVLLIGGAVTVGPVEMHLTEPDWFLHGHHEDDAYAGVILHVLAETPKRQVLPVPTLVAHALVSSDPPALEATNALEAPEISPGMIAELSWERFLRRAITMLRSMPPAPVLRDLRRAFVPRLFDALGYMTNRVPMQAVAQGVLEQEVVLEHAGFDDTARLVFARAGLPVDRVADTGARFMSQSRLHEILADRYPAPDPGWDLSVRVGAAPERRLWGAVKLLVDLYRGRLLAQLLGRVASGGTVDELARTLVVRMGTESFIGLDRAREIVVNAVLPLALAGGAAAGDAAAIVGACRAYKEAPSLPSNRIVRSVEQRWLRSRSFVGAFWQQGAIELHQRVLSADRSALSFIAEPSRTAARSVICQ